MTTIRVNTSIEIIDNMGRPVVSLSQATGASPGDNSRFWATYARGACQLLEHKLADMLIAQYGDKPDD